MGEKYSYVYILCSQRYGIIYVGVTSELMKRVFEHNSKKIKGFTTDYNVNKLVYYEIYDDISQAILREKQLKKWNRNWKIRLIEERNLYWDDLYDSL